MPHGRSDKTRVGRLTARVLEGWYTHVVNNNRSFGTLIFRAFKPFMRSPEGGADTIVYLASSPEAGSMTGRYLTDRKIVSSFEEPHDEVAQKRLWEVSEGLTNLRVAS